MKKNSFTNDSTSAWVLFKQKPQKVLNESTWFHWNLLIGFIRNLDTLKTG